MRSRLSSFSASDIAEELDEVRAEIDAIAFGLYGFSETDGNPAQDPSVSSAEENLDDEDEDEGANERSESITPSSDALSWAVGVAFGRFDWRLATGERKAPAEPEPFDPLPAKSPGMLPDGAEPFHSHAGILVDDQGHPHDLAHLIEEVLGRVNMPVPEDVRRWLQRDFFAFHLQHYSKSRRKAPIYWPLSTTSGSYTLWVYYPSGAEVKAFVSRRMQEMFGNENYEFWISNERYYFIKGITWSLRGSRFSPRVLPAGSIFSVRGYSAFVSPGEELASLALMNSVAFDYIFKSALGRFGFPEFIVGTLQKLPWEMGKGQDLFGTNQRGCRERPMGRNHGGLLAGAHQKSQIIVSELGRREDCFYPTKLSQ